MTSSAKSLGVIDDDETSEEELLPPTCAAKSPGIHLAHVAHSNQADSEASHIGGFRCRSHIDACIVSFQQDRSLAAAITSSHRTLGTKEALAR